MRLACKALRLWLVLAATQCDSRKLSNQRFQLGLVLAGIALKLVGKTRRVERMLFDARIDRRALPAPAQNIDGKLYVPAVEFMRLFGKTVTVE